MGKTDFKRATQEGASCERVDVDLGAVGDAQLEFPGGAIMSLRIAPKEKISGKADRSVSQGSSIYSLYRIL